MPQDCENLKTCGFFKKYFNVNRAVCRTFIREYCRGESQDDCERKKYRAQHGTAPSDDMLPNGVIVP